LLISVELQFGHSVSVTIYYLPVRILLLLLLLLLFLWPLPFYGHYTGQPALASTPSYEPEDFVVEQSFTAHMLLLR